MSTCPKGFRDGDEWGIPPAASLTAWFVIYAGLSLALSGYAFDSLVLIAVGLALVGPGALGVRLAFRGAASGPATLNEEGESQCEFYRP